MNYSRILKVEHDEPRDKDGEGAYTVFTLVQPFQLDLKIADRVFFQTFAILWNDEPDPRIIEVVETGLLQGILSPIKLLRAAELILYIVYSNDINSKAQSLFEERWGDIAQRFNWLAHFIPELQVSMPNTGDHAFSQFADEVLFSHSIGLWEVTEARLRRHRMVDC